MEQKKGKTTLEPLFCCSDLAFVVEQQNQDLIQKTKTETPVEHIGVFGVLEKVLFQKFTGDV